MINQDDLAVGMFFTIDSWKPKKVPDMGTDMPFIFPPAPESRVGVGEVYEIKALQLPFIAVECHSVAPMKGKVFPMDTREVNLIRVSKDYVDALMVTAKVYEVDVADPNKFIRALFGESVGAPLDPHDDDEDYDEDDDPYSNKLTTR
jgi:hypothetical protein